MKRDRKKKKNTENSLRASNVDFILHTPLFDAISVKSKITFQKRRSKKSLIDFFSTYQSILSEFEEP